MALPSNSPEVLESSLKKFKNSAFKVAKVKINEGYGHGIIFGLSKAKGEVLGWTHADLQTDPEDVFRAYEIFEKNKKDFAHTNFLIKGNRVKIKIGETLFTFGMSSISSIVMKKKLFDINAQPKLFSRSFYKSLENPPNDFSLDLYLLCMAKKNNYPIITFDVFFKERIHGESKWAFSFSSKIKTISRTISYIFDLKKKISL